MIPKFHRPFTPAPASRTLPGAAPDLSSSTPLRNTSQWRGAGAAVQFPLRGRSAESAPQSRPSRRLTIVGASRRPDGTAGNVTLLTMLASEQLMLPVGHPGLGLAAVDDVRGALRELKFARNLTVGQSLTESCVIGYKPRFEALLTLIEHGVVDSNAFDLLASPGETLMHVIGKNRSDGMDFTFGYYKVEERVRMLVDAGADIDARCFSRNMTPLDHACEKNNPWVIKALVNCGATRGVYPEAG
ncbi:MAG: ankyrin repeat domain-containing protein [Herminiimonas sp.]|nr:ankyrin repeat domain-containing protein [Herminiimonas sp.]